ncbi:hypothetical protein K435DRAFT_788956 [Dendrothele bispora CBS 962.96]|uniref:Uncharacterized protein n=1 Tax=Dendrothele bispora (strain CBS 962.96) TaxID=1314807 RepID=A0A4S8MW04_DENBC|nr:hypothetical protein K435DRAFT_788956 [Dendrothele bispora CBS 962.96]
MPNYESSQVLDLKLQVAKAQGLLDNSPKVLELKLKLNQARDREAKAKKNTKPKKNSAKSDENEDTSGSTRTTIISGGKQQQDFDQELATKLFLNIDIAKSNKYKEFSLEGLGTFVRNRHGLVTGGQEQDIREGSEIANAWGNTRSSCCSHGGSPIVDRSAVANSTTMVDLSVLRDNKDDIEQPLAQESMSLNNNDNLTGWNIENSDYDLLDDIENSGLDSSSQTEPPSPSRNLVIDPHLMQDPTQTLPDPAIAKTTVNPNTTISKPNNMANSNVNRTRSASDPSHSSSSTEPAPKKRKLTMQETLQETITNSCQSFLQAQELKQKTRLEVEECKLAFAREQEKNQQDAQLRELEDRKAAREHEHIMMMHQLELERLHHGLVPQ